MTFLNPAILIGLFAAAIPILIHLLNLRKLKKIEFSSLQFLKELQKNKIKKIKIKQWLLLLLRILLILFLVSAFARPAFEGVSLAGLSTSAKTSAIFIIDDTFSMSAITTNGTLFNKAKESAISILSNLKDEDEAAVIFVSELNDNIKLSANIEEQINTLKNSEISDVSKPIYPSLLKALDVLSQSKNFNKEIYIFSDFQKDRITEENLPQNLKELLGRTRIYAIRAEKENIINLSIDDLKIVSQIFELNKNIEIKVDITNHSPAALNNKILSVFINNEKVAQQNFSIEGNGKKEIIIQAPIKSKGFSAVKAELDDDDIEKDNFRFTDFFVADKIPLLILTDELEEARFISVALNAVNQNEQFEIKVIKSDRFQSIDINKFNGIIIIGGDNVSVETIKSFIQNGGGVFYFPGYNTSENVINNFYSAFGLSNRGRIILKNQSKPAFFQTIKKEHPIFSGLFNKAEEAKIESPEIVNYYGLNSHPGAIINLIDNSVFLGEIFYEKGKLLYSSTPPVLECSSFPLKNIFAPLIYRSALYITGKDRSREKIFAGDTYLLSTIPYRNNQAEVVLPAGNNKEVLLFTNQPYYQFTNTSITGTYKIVNEDKLQELFSVNTNPVESKTEYLTISGLEDYFKSLHIDEGTEIINLNGNIVDEINRVRHGSELWKLFLAIALIIAIVEMLLSRNTKREIASVAAN